jgi:hypothetical protein
MILFLSEEFSLNKLKYSLSIVLIIGIIHFRTDALTAQSATVSRIKENKKPDLALYFYPSTLRMINLSDNEDFDQLVKEIRKIRFFQWGLENNPDIDEKSLIRDLTEEDFEECMVIQTGEMDMMVYGREQRKKQPELVAIVETKHQIQLLDIQGIVNVAKIPALINNLNSADFINVLDLNNKKKK